MPLPKSNTYTIDDIYALPEGQRAELIDGQIYDMAPPSPMHQEHQKEWWIMQSLPCSVCCIFK